MQFPHPHPREPGKAFEGRNGAFLQLRDLILTVKPSCPVLWAVGGSQMVAQPCPGLADRAASVHSFPLSASSARPSSLVAKFLNNAELYVHGGEEELQSVDVPVCATRSRNSCRGRTPTQKQSRGLADRGSMKELPRRVGPMGPLLARETNILGGRDVGGKRTVGSGWCLLNV